MTAEAKKPEPRDDFTQATIRLIAQRAGLRCSFPNCPVLTTGPSLEENKTANQGTAAHIVSASPSEGPRADRKMSSADRKAAANGIWLCATHARLIDSDEKRFTVVLLKQWKRDHEDRMALEMSGIFVGNGVVTSLSIENLGRFATKQSITFGTKTLLLGNNQTGKQLVCDCIGALADFEKLKKWQRRRRNNARGNVAIETFTKTKNKWDVALDDRILCNTNGSPVPKVFSGFKVIELNRGFDVPDIEPSRDSFPGLTDNEWEDVRWKLRQKNTVDALAKHVGFSTEELLTMLQLMSLNPQRYFADVEIRGEEVGWKVGNDTHYWAFENLGSGKSQLVLIDLFLRVAEFCAQFAPTVLILNQHGFPSLDEDNLNLVIEQLRQASLQSQLVVPLFSWGKVRSFDGWRTWHLHEVAKDDGPVEVRQHEVPGKVGDAEIRATEESAVSIIKNDLDPT
jgi:hypothetical protein